MNPSPESAWTPKAKPAREDCVLPFILERNARETPDRIQFQFERGETWSGWSWLTYPYLTAEDCILV